MSNRDLQRLRKDHPLEQPAAGNLMPIEARAVTVRGNHDHVLLNAVTFTVPSEGTTVVLGSNGAGKTVLLKTLAGLIAPSDGAVTWRGAKPTTTFSHRLGFVFQKPVLFRRSARQNIEMVLVHVGQTKSEAMRRATEALDESGLAHIADNPARQLSGGEQQRLAIARARALEPEVLFLDEPTAHLDPASTGSIEAMVKATAARGTPILHVTHDLAQARRLADHIVFLHQGEILEQQPASEFFAQPMSNIAAAYLRGELVW